MRYEWTAVLMWLAYGGALGMFIYIVQSGEWATSSWGIRAMAGVGLLAATAVVIYTAVQERQRLREGADG